MLRPNHFLFRIVTCFACWRSLFKVTLLHCAFLSFLLLQLRCTYKLIVSTTHLIDTLSRHKSLVSSDCEPETFSISFKLFYSYILAQSASSGQYNSDSIFLVNWRIKMATQQVLSSGELHSRFLRCEEPGRHFITVDLRASDFEGGTIKGSLNIPMASLPPSIPTLFHLASSAGISDVIFFCG